MMEISRKSWHYRLASDVYNIPHQSLCIYFWQVVSAAFVRILHIGFLMFMACFVIGFFAVPITWGLGELGWIKPVVPGEVAAVPIAIMSIAAAAALAIFLLNGIKYLIEEYQYKRKKKNRQKGVAKEPNLVVEYIRAKKQKVCPTLKFKD